ncbi:MAG: hypothetical protein RQ899_14795 [Pseudomonadales bacterium]|nr:hypothetical protein [Pseudomonadales bacterium]
MNDSNELRQHELPQHELPQHSAADAFQRQNGTQTAKRASSRHRSGLASQQSPININLLFFNNLFKSITKNLHIRQSWHN